MKTLDEVIKAIEATWVCPCDNEDGDCEMMEVREDALAYLEQYKAHKEDIAAAIDELTAFHAWQKEMEDGKSNGRIS